MFFHNAGYSTACGHGTIALVTWALDEGVVDDDESIFSNPDPDLWWLGHEMYDQAGELTHDFWEVHSVEISPSKDRFYLTTSEGSPHEQHFHHMRLDGSGRTRITTMPGQQDATPSPDGSRIAFVHSFANTPPELYVAANRAGADARRITTSPTAEWSSFDWLAPEIVHVPARDGVQVPARIYRPQDVGAQPNRGRLGARACGGRRGARDLGRRDDCRDVQV